MSRVELSAQDRTMADAVMQRAVEGLHGRAWALHAEGRIAARQLPGPRVEHILAQNDVLTRDILLVRAAAIVAADDTAVGRRPLRPVDKPTVEFELFRRVVTRRQSVDERGNLAGRRVHGHDARAVVLPSGMGRLIGVRGEEPPSLKATFERDVDRRPRGLKAAGLGGAAPGGLGQRAEQFPSLVEYQDVGCERIGGTEGTTNDRRLLVAYAGQAMTGFQHIYFKFLGIA